METKKAKSLFQKLPNITKHQPLQYKSVFDMDNPSVDLTKDYANAKECLSKLPTAQKAEYTKCARLCFYAEPGVMPRYLTYDEIKYVKYLSAFGYKVIIGDWSCNIGLGVKPTKEMLGGGGCASLCKIAAIKSMKSCLET
ncbi:hypothetical protein [uncultured Helicobacter sp.]|uniref:hypothetical protein n=1 Tax=uncultured Helicobacter sp. TaxID=175537 RepID=UPI00261956F3|nr:hypothetical protein [uncultured Helicobacter sp.]